MCRRRMEMSDELGRRKRVEGLPKWVRRLMANEED